MLKNFQTRRVLKQLNFRYRQLAYQQSIENISQENRVKDSVEATFNKIKMFKPSYFDQNMALFKKLNNDDKMTLLRKLSDNKCNEATVNLIFSLSNSTTIPDDLSSSIFSSVCKDQNRERLRKFRLFFERNPVKRAKITFNQDDLNKVLSTMKFPEESLEACKWMSLSVFQKKCELSPEILSFMFNVTVKMRCWDQLYFILGEMRVRGIILNKNQLETLVREASVEPLIRWQQVRQSLLECVATKETTEKIFQLNPELLSDALDILLKANEPKIAKNLFIELQEILEKKGNPLDIPIFDSKIMLSVALISLELNEEEFIQKFILKNLKENVKTINGMERVDELESKIYEKNISNSDFWTLLAEALFDLNESGNLELNKSGRHFGIIILNLLNHTEIEKAVEVWNKFLNTIEHSTLGSELISICLTDIIQSLTRYIEITTEDKNAKLLENISSFLSHLLFFNNPVDGNGQPTQMPGNLFSRLSPFPEFVTLEEREAVNLLKLFSFTFNHSAAVCMLARCLQQEIYLPLSEIENILQEILRQGDPELVLDIFEQFIQRFDKFEEKAKLISQPSPKTDFSFLEMHEEDSEQRSSGDKTEKSKKMRETKGKLSGSSLSPRIFNVVLQALTEISDLEMIRNILSYELPKRGYIPSPSAYSFILSALKDSGDYKSAVDLYWTGLDLYRSTDVKKRTLPSKTHNQKDKKPSSIAVFETQFMSYRSTFLIALECCAKGKLGTEAVQLFAMREEWVNANQTSRERKSGQVMQDMLLVVRALATKENISSIPVFLQSLNDSDNSLLTSKKLLKESVAAAVAFQDTDVILQIEKIAKLHQNCSIFEIFDGNLEELFISVEKSGILTDFTREKEEIKDFVVKLSLFDIENEKLSL